MTEYQTPPYIIERRKFQAANGRYPRQTVEPTDRSVYLAWGRDFDNSPRHCFRGIDPDNGNAPTNWMNGTGERCLLDHASDDKTVGESEWMRFIHEFGQLAKAKLGEKGNPFTGTDADGRNYTLLIESTGAPVAGGFYGEGKVLWCETYLDIRKEYETKIVFRVFIWNERQYARIECYEPELKELCEEADLIVQASYERQPKEVTA